jgi:hypothetical protein
MHWVLSAALYFDQFSARVLSAACSSARQDSLVRPTAMASPAAALQLGETSSLGGLSASAIAGSPSIRTTTAILLAEADIVRGLSKCAMLAVRARPQRRTGAWCSVPSPLASRLSPVRSRQPPLTFFHTPPRRAHQRPRHEARRRRTETPAPDRRERSRGFARAGPEATGSAHSTTVEGVVRSELLGDRVNR